MTDIATSKMLGIMGSLLIFLSVLINFFLINETNLSSYILMIVIFIIGLILMLLSIKFISDIIKNESIFTSYFLYAILWIVALCIPIIILQPLVDTITASMYFIVSFVVGLVARSIFLVASCFLTRSFKLLSKFEKTGLFNTIGPLYITGTALILVLFVFASILEIATLPLIGGIFMLIAAVIQILSFAIMPVKLKKPVT
jgi:uncharacterized membrane protein